MFESRSKIASHVSSCLQLGILLEASAPKPGNVTRTSSFRSTRYEHYLASAIAVYPSFVKAAERGVKVAEKEIKVNDIGIGRIVKGAIVNVNAWQHGGNTILGTIFLLIPISTAAGMALVNQKKFSISELRKNIKTIVESTTSFDAVAVYEAIKLASPNGLAGKAPVLDVNDPGSKREILRKGTTLYEIFKISASYDSIAKEWVENYPITFETGLPYFKQQLRKGDSLRNAIVHTFLKVLSTFPDTFIARKVGLEKAKEVSVKAGEVLKHGGLGQPLGRKKLLAFDKMLRKSTNQLNPGTTADIIATVLALNILSGYRP